MLKTVINKSTGGVAIFNTKTGQCIRYSDDTQADYPHLIDIGVMGHCDHGASGLCAKAGIGCYQSGATMDNPNMTLKGYKAIIDESKDRVFEVALGGCGDVDQHEHFEELLSYAVEANIVPNFTTSGLGMTKEKAEICKKYCGAVAVSMYSRLDMTPVSTFSSVDGGIGEHPIVCECTHLEDTALHMHEHNPPALLYREKKILNNYTIQAMRRLIDAGVKTNVHFVLSRSTINEAIFRLKYNGFPDGINAVVFLLHKPVGQGSEWDVLTWDNNGRVLDEFLGCLEKNPITGEPHKFKIGFDSCSIPMLLNSEKAEFINPMSLDTCEGARFSMYITADMVALPCSFDVENKKYAVPINHNTTIEEAWNSEKFNEFREIMNSSCPSCEKRNSCMGGCPLEPSIVLCGDKHDKYGVQYPYYVLAIDYNESGGNKYEN